MTEQEKQELIEWAHKWIEPARRTVENNPQDDSAKASLALYEIALASLTAPPVKKPGTECIGWVKEAIQEHDAKWCDAIRAAGYEVEE